MEPYINPQTGKEVRLVDRVLTYGLSETENAYVGKLMPAKDCELIATDFVTDLYAYKSFAVILRAGALNDGDRRELEGFYRELEYTTAESILWLGEPKPVSRVKHMVHCYDTWDDLRHELKQTLSAAYRRVNEIRDLRSELALTIRLLRQIEHCPGIRSRALADTLSISKRSIQRYIDVLRAAEENVKYDRSLHGWVLERRSAENVSALHAETEQ